MSKYKKHLSAVTFPRRRLLYGMGDDRDSESDEEGGYLPPVYKYSDFHDMDVEKEGGYVNLIKNLVLKLYDPSLPSDDTKMLKFQINSIKRYLKSHKPKIYKHVMDELSGERTLRKAKTRDINELRRSQMALLNEMNHYINITSPTLKESRKQAKAMRKTRKGTNLKNIVWERIKQLPDNKIPDFNQIFNTAPVARKIPKRGHRNPRNIPEHKMETVLDDTPVTTTLEDVPMEEPYDDVYTPDLTITPQEEQKYFVDKNTGKKFYFDKYGRFEEVDEDKQGSGMKRRGNGEMLKKFNKSVRKLRKCVPN